MAIKELYIPADRGTMDPLVDNEPYSCDILKIFSTREVPPLENIQGLISKERMADDFVLSEDPKNILDNPTIFTPPNSGTVYCLVHITVHRKDRLKQWTKTVGLHKWSNIPRITPMPFFPR